MNQIKQKADALGMALETGAISRSDVVAWADSLIETTEQPLEWMIELSLSANKHYLDVVHMLREVPGEIDDDLSFKLFLDILSEKKPSISVKDKNFVRGLFSLVLLPLSEDFKNLIYQIDMDLDVFEEGYGTWAVIQEDYSELLSGRRKAEA